MIHGAHIDDRDLLLFLDGEIASGGRSDVAEHLAECEACRERLDAVDSTMRAFVEARRRSYERPVSTPIVSPTDPLWTRRAWVAGIAVVLLGVAALAIARHTHPDAVLAESPRATLTPGETVTSDARRLCQESAFSDSVPEKTAREVLREYGISSPRSGGFEVDYLITPELGGAPSVHNLWPEPYQHTVWNARVKDQLETRLRGLVCSGEVDLATAQHDIATDWIGAYKKYFHRDAPPVGERRL